MRYSPVRHGTRGPKPSFPFDLHVSTTPPAFVLSQDQTLQLRKVCTTSPRANGTTLALLVFFDQSPADKPEKVEVAGKTRMNRVLLLRSFFTNTKLPMVLSKNHCVEKQTIDTHSRTPQKAKSGTSPTSNSQGPEKSLSTRHSENLNSFPKIGEKIPLIRSRIKNQRVNPSGQSLSHLKPLAIACQALIFYFRKLFLPG